jgi:protein TonB
MRFSGAVVLAAVACLWLLARSVGWLSGHEMLPPAAAPVPKTIEMQLVELPTPAPAPARVAPSAPPAQAQAVSPQRTLTHAAIQLHAPMQQRSSVHAAPASVQPPHEETHSPIEPPAHDQAQASAAVAQAASSATSTTSNNTGPAPLSTASGSTQARLLSQPMPVLPDDLREQGYQLTAVARFKVHADGTFDVELVKPTQNPRLNQILLETLHRWRFFPAMENGHPVESDQDVRVHFSVS